EQLAEATEEHIYGNAGVAQRLKPCTHTSIKLPFSNGVGGGESTRTIFTQSRSCQSQQALVATIGQFCTNRLEQTNKLCMFKLSTTPTGNVIFQQIGIED